jgi:hypothetical protein
MPTIADYTVIQDTAVTIPKSNGDIEANLLQATNNTLTVTKNGGSGSLTVSDLVMHFQATI